MEPGYPEPLHHSFETGTVSPQNLRINSQQQSVLDGVFKHSSSISSTPHGIGHLLRCFQRPKQLPRPTHVQWDLPQDRWNYYQRQDAFLQSIQEQRAPNLGKRLYHWLAQQDLIKHTVDKDNGKNHEENDRSYSIRIENEIYFKADLLLIAWDNSIIETGGLSTTYYQSHHSYHLLDILDI